MNENTLTIDRRELITIIRNELAFLKQADTAKDVISRDEAIKLLGIARQTFANYLSAGIIKAATVGGKKKFFSRKEILGLKKTINNKKK